MGSQGEPLELLPFEEGLKGLKLYARVSRRGGLLEVEYRLGGERADEVVFDPVSSNPSRKDGLWERTCFELFVAEAAHPWYWEANLSPSLDWQLYHFRSYREARKPESRIQSIRGEKLTENQAGHGFRLTLDASGLFAAKATIDLGLTAVVQTSDGKQSYWALAHAGSKPDFHLRKSFTFQPA